MRGLWRNNVKQKEKIIEGALRKQNQHAFKLRGLNNVNEGHQVHAFILGFVQECVYPAVIAFHSAQRTQVLQGAANHARHGSNRFQDNRAMAIPMREKNIREEPQKLNQSISNPVAKILWSVVLL
jgi:hypothetical protein